MVNKKIPFEFVIGKLLLVNSTKSCGANLTQKGERYERIYSILSQRTDTIFNT